MKKILNEPQAYVDEMLDGLCLAHPDVYRRAGESGRVIARAAPARDGKVGVVSGGGSGHLPLFTGYVGTGLLDACAIGNVFAGPTVGDCVDAMREADHGAGVLRLYGNYGGDRMNFDMAGELAEIVGMESTTVLVTDDVASASSDERAKRRGVAGVVYAYRFAGAKAEQAGATLADVTAVARKAVDGCRSIGVALTPCIVPEVGTPSFTIDDGEIEMGMGIHGEPGLWRGPLKPADALADEMLERILVDLGAGRGERVSVLVNSLGATPYEELYIVYRAVARGLQARGVQIVTPLVGRYATSMEMTGVSLTLQRLDGELEALLQAPAVSPFWRA
ncbi:dihydroxyacetone kinase subunit K (plasmid) [Paraburkholderia caribensis MBA4]|uniref:Dihydroxyacetone kinase subunit K n=1 Tax=Paraburkholderia caribensis MBA4 TaxID=1323664 RepID=A0A0P0RMC2_9BURK|nr:dihydroxyacetone kinase subunit DhaK [Paraburkholderia caribensis]ALL69931.1 dihydroxyacetone kinase subunit K [Paraburkholderia caribensis MBA4]